MNRHSVRTPAWAGPALDYGRCHDAAGGNIARLIGVIGCYWRTLVERSRRESEIAQAIEHLQGMTDAQLRDLDLRRADIEQAVRHGR